jgi:hypothetical protein
VTYFGTQAELQGNGIGQCPVPVATKTLNGSVAGVGLTEMANIGLGGAIATVTGVLGSTFQLKNVSTSAADLLASRATFDGGTGSLTTNKLILRRATNYADGSTIPVLDFGASEAFDPATATLTLNNLGADQGNLILSYLTGNGTAATLAFGQTGATQPMQGVPDAKQLAGDLHLLNVIGGDQAATSTRYYLTYFKTLANKTVDLGPLLNLPTITTLATTPYPRYKAVAAIQSEYGTQFTAVFSNTTSGANSRSWTILATRGYFGAAASYDLTIADFAGVAGWNNTWALLTGQTEAFISGAGWTGTGGQIEGGVARGATRQITLP